MNRIQTAGGPRMFVQLDGIKKTLSEHNQLIRDIWKDPAMGPAERRQLVDQLYSSMIRIGQAGKQAMRQVDKSLEKTPYWRSWRARNDSNVRPPDS